MKKNKRTIENFMAMNMTESGSTFVKQLIEIYSDRKLTNLMVYMK